MLIRIQDESFSSQFPKNQISVSKLWELIRFNFAFRNANPTLQRHNSVELTDGSEILDAWGLEVDVVSSGEILRLIPLVIKELHQERTLQLPLSASVADVLAELGEDCELKN